jgi:phosphotransferase system enzyme I (PtsI)
MKEKEVQIKGVSISSGKIMGQICLYSSISHNLVSEYTLSDDEEAQQEVEHFEKVLMQCSHELNRIASEVAERVGKTEAEIFLTQKHIMNDPKVVSLIKKLVLEERRNLGWAISEVLSSYEEKFASLDNQYLRERSSDIGEIKRRLLSRVDNMKNGFVCHGQHDCVRGANRIIIAEELTSEMIAYMDLNKVLGFATEHGGITSHAAIIARSIGIPAVTGLADIMKHVKCGDILLIDGDEGVVYVHPDEKTVSTLIEVEQVQSSKICFLGSPSGMEVLANAGTIEDVRHAWSTGADGIGLLRTEAIFIKENRLLAEEEQFLFYRKIISEMHGKPVTFRFLDIGGDKPFPFLKLKKESNPFLGWRGSRFLLGNPEIFRSQIKAFGMLSNEEKVKIMFPMVVDSMQLQELMAVARQTLLSMKSNPDNIQFGAMFEVPSAFIQAAEIFELVEFGSIGSNDLIQYLFAIDRSNELVSQYYDPDHPVLWNMLSSLSATARKTGKSLSICGEIAGKEGIVKKLLNSGIYSLSVAPRLIPRVRNEMAKYAETVK